MLNDYVWLFPIIFIFHDMEEIIGFGIWLGAFVGCTLHFVVHIVQALWLRQYIPATYTSIICLPISIWILYRCFLNIDDVWWHIAICIVVGIVIVVVNLKFAQKMIGWFTHKAGLTPLI